MRLLVVRHAIAMDRADFARSGKDDSERPLTKEGRDKMQKGARGLREIVPTIDALASSPLVRAADTAAIVAAAYDSVPIVTIDELKPDAKPVAFLRWLKSQHGKETVAIVGHEPHLSTLVSWLLAGRNESFVILKKGAACMLEFDRAPASDGAMLSWALTPAQLRQLAP
jgi:phosphohistidine phosphatase